MTIKGAQKLLREQGVKHVILLGTTSDDAVPVVEAAPPPSEPIAVETTPDNIVTLSPEPVVVAPLKTPRPQILTMLVVASQSTIRRNAGVISPHVTQLAALRDRIRQSL